MSNDYAMDRAFSIGKHWACLLCARESGLFLEAIMVLMINFLIMFLGIILLNCGLSLFGVPFNASGDLLITFGLILITAKVHVK